MYFALIAPDVFITLMQQAGRLLFADGVAIAPLVPHELWYIRLDYGGVLARCMEACYLRRDALCNLLELVLYGY
jgi:hypothetical protein